MIGLKAYYKSFSKAIMAHVNKELVVKLNTTAVNIQAKARKNASGRPGPKVQTGNLRRQIVVEPATPGFKPVAFVFALAPYSAPVEFGHGHISPYPYMQPAITSEEKAHIERLRGIIP